jgi:hypothetical protein
VAIDLTGFEPRVRARQSEWDALELTFKVKPISPNYGKAATSAEFESVDWLASVTVRFGSGVADGLSALAARIPGLARPGLAGGG